MTERPRLRLTRTLFEQLKQRISADFRTGMHAIVIPKTESAQSFVESANGTREPLRGTIRLLSKTPFRSPQLRARVGSVLPFEPRHTSNQTVRSFLLEVEHLRGSQKREAPVDRLLEPLLDRSLSDLDDRSRRRLALSLALSIENPVALFLDEPLFDLSIDETHWVLGELEKRAELDTIVICLTRTRHDALLLSRRIQTWGGQTVRKKDHGCFSILCADPGLVAKSFVDDPQVVEARISTESPFELILTFADPKNGAPTITRCLANQTSEIFQVTHVSASLVPTEPIAPEFSSVHFKNAPLDSGENP